MQNLLAGLSAPSSDWADAVPLMRWSGFLPGLREAAGMEGLSGPQAGPKPLAGPLPAQCGFMRASMTWAWAAHCPGQGSGVFCSFPLCFLDLRRGEKPAIMIPFHPTFIWPPETPALV